MTIEEFEARHQLQKIEESHVDAWLPETLGPYEEDDEDEFRFYINESRTVALAINDTKEEVRVVYAEMGLADTGWISRNEALAMNRLD